MTEVIIDHGGLADVRHDGEILINHRGSDVRHMGKVLIGHGRADVRYEK